MIEVSVGDEHRIRSAFYKRVFELDLTSKVSDAWPQDRVGDDPDSVQVDHCAGMTDEGQEIVTVGGQGHAGTSLSNIREP